jgi:hypothetical protein
MKKTVIILLAIVGLFSCKDKDEPAIPTIPEPLPVAVRYDITQGLVHLDNNPDSAIKLAGYTGSYSIKFIDPSSTKQRISYAFVQNDTGSIYISQRYGISRHVLILSTRDFEGYHLYLKFDVGYDDFDVSPAVLVPGVTTEFTITRKSTGRTMTVPINEFTDQGTMGLWYDQ